MLSGPRQKTHDCGVRGGFSMSCTCALNELGTETERNLGAVVALDYGQLSSGVCIVRVFVAMSLIASLLHLMQFVCWIASLNTVRIKGRRLCLTRECG